MAPVAPWGCGPHGVHTWSRHPSCPPLTPLVTPLLPCRLDPSAQWQLLEEASKKRCGASARLWLPPRMCHPEPAGPAGRRQQDFPRPDPCLAPQAACRGNVEKGRTRAGGRGGGGAGLQQGQTPRVARAEAQPCSTRAGYCIRVDASFSPLGFLSPPQTPLGSDPKREGQCLSPACFPLPSHPGWGSSSCQVVFMAFIFSCCHL